MKLCPDAIPQPTQQLCNKFKQRTRCRVYAVFENTVATGGPNNQILALNITNRVTRQCCVLVRFKML